MENPSGAVGGNSQNNPTANVPRTRSTFPLKYHFMDTHRFGEYHPHYVEDGVKEDDLPIRSSHNVMSYTLKSPLMQDITMSKDYFLVPMEAILPLNWEKFFDNPVRGQDVTTDVGPTVENFWSKAGSFFSNLVSALGSYYLAAGSTIDVGLQATFRCLVIGEYFYSNGSLLASLGCHGAPYIRLTRSGLDYSYDNFFDWMINKVAQLFQGEDYFELVIDGNVYNVGNTGALVNYNRQITFRTAICLMRDNPHFKIQNVGTTSSSPLTTLSSALTAWTVTPLLAEVPLNLSRVWAYQLCCAHYYSNDHIDFVYSAELFRQLIGNYIVTFLGASTWNTAMYFTRNGIKYQYDYLSARGVDRWFILANSTGNPASLLTQTSHTTFLSLLGFLSALFSYRRSLRYQDYFTGSRAQPLAVGSTGVTVSGGSVDVVDITRNIQRQRFLNAVNRVRHNFEGYLQGIFGGETPAPDYHNPFFLASTSDTVFGQETENTAGAQMSDKIAITTNLRSNGARYMLEIHCDRPCVVLGITHYDMPRVYTRTIERSFFHKDRFDMFNPFMQFIGDQPIYLQELGVNHSGNDLISMATFAYTLRHMEYKQRYNQCAGGFVENLPGFAFLAVDDRSSQVVINPDWIRSLPSEFDNFYVSLTGWSLGSYFHFIVDNFNDCSGSRPMAFAPSIL